MCHHVNRGEYLENEEEGEEYFLLRIRLVFVFLFLFVFIIFLFRRCPSPCCSMVLQAIDISVGGAVAEFIMTEITLRNPSLSLRLSLFCCCCCLFGSSPIQPIRHPASLDPPTAIHTVGPFFVLRVLPHADKHNPDGTNIFQPTRKHDAIRICAGYFFFSYILPYVSVYTLFSLSYSRARRSV